MGTGLPGVVGFLVLQHDVAAVAGFDGEDPERDGEMGFAAAGLSEEQDRSRARQLVTKRPANGEVVLQRVADIDGQRQPLLTAALAA